MKRYVFGILAFASLVAMVGCGDSDTPSTKFEKSELEKYVEENPVALVGEDDFVSGHEEEE